MHVATIVHSGAARGVEHRPRTLRSLESAGLAPRELSPPESENLAKILAAGGPILLVRAGVWLVHPGPPVFPAPSSTGKGLCAVGAVRRPWGCPPTGCEEAQGWDAVLARTGGELDRLARPGPHAQESPATACDVDWRAYPALCDPAIVYWDERATRALRAVGPPSLAELIRFSFERLRVVHAASLDVWADEGLRVLQVVTSLQRGGAERVVLDLAAELPGQNVRSRVATLGTARRATFAPPDGLVELAKRTAKGATPAALIPELATQFGADIIHAHLLSQDDLRLAGSAGHPLVVTVHNTQPGWPPGLGEAGGNADALYLACSHAVAAELRAAGVSGPVRTAWNGIEIGAFEPTEARRAAGRELRSGWGFGPSDLVLASIANPRPQKRLERLPGILASVRRRIGRGQEARLVLCGDFSSTAADASNSTQALRDEIGRQGVGNHIRWVPPTASVAEVLAAADILVSTSAHEGLSLAQLEALAAGCRVVCTAVGGAGEIAARNPRMHLVPVDADPDRFAEACALREPEEHRRIGLRDAANWSRRTMAARHHWLYSRKLKECGRRARGTGLWLVTNNFATGGAQTSAGRLLRRLHLDGISVRAAVVEEHPEHPTKGRARLQEDGVKVFAAPAGPGVSGMEAVERLLAEIDADPPSAVFFWNLRPEYKVLLADGLCGTPTFDVSPGGMLFDSLERYFATDRPGWPYRFPGEYGACLAGVVVKYGGEAERARRVLGAPVQVVPNGVLLPDVRPAPERASAAGPLVFGSAARIHPQKRLQDLIEAFRVALPRLPPCILRIAGGVENGCDDYASGLRELAKGLPVEWLGELTDPAPFLRDLDVFVMISEPPGCPNASLEAMAAGIPVIATDVGGASEQVVDGVTGRLAAARDAGAFAEALASLACNRELRRRLGEAARRRAEEVFSLDRMAAEYRRILRACEK